MNLNKGTDGPLTNEELDRLACLLENYAKGQCSDEESRAVERWYEQINGETEVSTGEELAAKEKIWKNISTQTQQTIETDAAGGYPWLKWAASIVIICAIGLGTYFYTGRYDRELSVVLSGNPDWHEIKNDDRHPRSITLPDQSVVVLQPNASFSYPKSFSGSERIVHLEGEAFFNVQRNPSSPFKVVTGKVTTRVLGTSFTVSALQHSPVVEVKVRTGKVSVYEAQREGKESDGVILTPNQKVTYYKTTSQWVTELVENPLPDTTSGTGPITLSFKDRSVREVLAAVSDQYYIEILVSNDAIYDCFFTGDVSGMQLHDMLKVICKSIRASYEVKGTRILINGEGCK